MRTPEQKEKRRIAQARRRSEHPDEYQAQMDAANGRLMVRKVRARAGKLVSVVLCGNREGSALTKQIAFHLSRGRDVGDIVCRMMIPASVVREVMERLKTENPTQAVA